LTSSRRDSAGALSGDLRGSKIPNYLVLLHFVDYDLAGLAAAGYIKLYGLVDGSIPLLDALFIGQTSSVKRFLLGSALSSANWMWPTFCGPPPFFRGMPGRS
jgi:hypothetical protein